MRAVAARCPLQLPNDMACYKSTEAMQLAEQIRMDL